MAVLLEKQNMTHKFYHNRFWNWIEKQHNTLGNWLWTKRWRNFKKDGNKHHKKKIMRLINDILTIKKTGKLAGHTGPHGAKPSKR